MVAYPPHLLVELLEERYPAIAFDYGDVPPGEKRVVEFACEYKAIGYVRGGTFIITSWSKVTSQSDDRARLEEALRVLTLAFYHTDDALREVHVADSTGAEINLESAIYHVLNGWSK